MTTPVSISQRGTVRPEPGGSRRPGRLPRVLSAYHRVCLAFPPCVSAVCPCVSMFTHSPVAQPSSVLRSPCLPVPSGALTCGHSQSHPPLCRALCTHLTPSPSSLLASTPSLHLPPFSPPRQGAQGLARELSALRLALIFVVCLVWLLCFETKCCYVAHDGLAVTLFLPRRPER